MSNPEPPLDGVASAAARTPGKPALIAGGVTTFAELDDRANRLAHALLDAGARPGGRIAVLLPNGPELFEANLAAARLRCLLVPINWHLKVEEVCFILEDCQPAVLIAAAGLSGAVPTPAPVPAVLWTGEPYEAALASQPAGRPEVAGAGAPQIMLYTSGTEGRPKGVLHEGGGRSRGPSELVTTWGLTAGDVHLLCGPAYHGAPWSYAGAHLGIGATVVIMPAGDRWDAEEFVAAVERHWVTTAFLVPTHMARILALGPGRLAGADLSSLRLVLHGGAPCPVALKDRFLTAFPTVETWEFYGFSEGGRVTRISAAEWRERPGSVGRAWPGVGIRILDAGGREQPAGRPGLVYVQPDAGARSSYHNDPGRTASAWRDGAVTVGDVGYLDPDGYLYLTDRASDMVVRGGVNIYPREIEEALHRHPGVADCAVFGIPDEVYGEELMALVEPVAGRPRPDPAELIEHVGRLLADFKRPRVVHLVDTLPRDPNGKIRKRLLRDQYWQGRDTAII